MQLQVNNISKIYPNGAGIRNISFTIESNGVYGILGANGAGKSTLFSVISGFASCCTNKTAPNG